MLTNLDKDSYWRTVEATLVEIFGIDQREAYYKTTNLRNKVNFHYQGRQPELFYNREEYDIALDLSDTEANEINWEKHKSHYFSIKERFYLHEEEKIRAKVSLDAITIELEGNQDYVTSQIKTLVEQLDSPNREVHVIKMTQVASL